VGRGIKKLSDRFYDLGLSQKISYAFAFFFLINAIQHVIDNQGFIDPFAIAATAAITVFVILAQWDNLPIRYFQVTLLLVLSLLSVWVNDDPSAVAPFVLLSIGLAAAYKMSLFGRRTIGVLLWITVIIGAVAFIAGMIHGFSILQRINILNFMVVYLGLLFIIFEEETLSLKKQHAVLTRKAAELQPFAELGGNIAGLVHDFKGDLSGIYALASIERHSDNTDIADKLQYYGERLNERIQSVLYVATANDHVEPEEIHVEEMLRRVVYYFVGINRHLKHKIEINLEVPDGLIIGSRRNVMLVVLENVIKNSIEATEGYPDRTIHISAEPGNGAVRITVEHRGRHLPWATAGGRPVDVRRSNYFRRGRSGRPGGTGLGMINVVRALEILDAEMVMENLPVGVRSTILHPLDTRPDDVIHDRSSV
jgi:signal transduction histidine kinase